MDVALRVHPVRGESHIQRNANGEVATGTGCSHKSVNIRNSLDAEKAEKLIKMYRLYKAETDNQ